VKSNFWQLNINWRKIDVSVCQSCQSPVIKSTLSKFWIRVLGQIFMVSNRFSIKIWSLVSCLGLLLLLSTFMVNGHQHG
jgi:hypothetical protein